jgi:hypothetical protein
MLVLYRVLLRLCPRQIRDENGAEMAALFAECVARERLRRGAWGGRLSSLRGFADLLMFAACARWERLGQRPPGSNRTAACGPSEVRLRVGPGRRVEQCSSCIRTPEVLIKTLPSGLPM